MNSSRINSSEIKSKRKRLFSWFPFHFSSLVPAFLLAALWVLIAIPGQRVKLNWSVLDSYEYGWPAVHLIRIPEGMQPLFDLEKPVNWAQTNRGHITSELKFWADPSAWKKPDVEFEEKWFPAACWINAATVVLSCLLVSVLLELRRRRRRSILHFTLADFFLLTLLAAIPFSWYRYHARSVRVAEKTVAHLTAQHGDEISFIDEINEPVWLSRLFDYRVNFGDGPRRSKPPSKPVQWMESLFFDAENRSLFLEYQTVNLRIRSLDIEQAKETGSQLATLPLKKINVLVLDDAHVVLLNMIPTSRIDRVNIRKISPILDPDLELLHKFEK